MEKKYLTLEVFSASSHKCLQIEWLEVESPNGSFTVGPGHSPLVSIIKKRSRIIYKKKDEGEDFIDVMGGICKVSPGKAILLLDA